MLLPADRGIAALAFAFAALLFCGSAAAADAKSGHQLAQRWCSGCHAVEANRASDKAPPFEVIARRPSSTPEHLRAWLSTPHDVMPDLSLSRQDIESIIAYMEQLRDG